MPSGDAGLSGSSPSRVRSYGGLNVYIAIDTVPERLALAVSPARKLSISRKTISTKLFRKRRGPGRRRVHRCRGHRARYDGKLGFDDRSGQVATYLATDRPHVLRQAIYRCRNFGTVSIVGVYGGYVHWLPMGSAINRGLTFRMAQTPVQNYLPKLLDRH